MGIIIEDHFTVGSDVDLKDHTPDTTGTGWTEIENTGTTTSLPRVLAAEDFVAMNTTDGNNRKLNTAQPGPTSAEYDVEIDILAEAVFANRPFWLLGRVLDASNYYGAFIDNTTFPDIFLVKKVSGTVTDLASADTDITWSGTTLKLELRDAAKKIYSDDVEKISNADNALTSAGEGGMAWGNIRNSNHDADSTWELDNFFVTEVDAGGGANPHGPLGHPLRGPLAGPVGV